jgi:hypothetical protein
MPNPTRDPQQQRPRVDKLQRQRERLYHAWVGGASVEDTATLMHSVLRLLPPSSAKKGRGRHAVSAADIPILDEPQR